MLIVPDLCRSRAALHRPGGDYARDIEADFHEIEPFLPGRVESILDIGCGLAGIDVFLKRRYPDADLILLDGNGERPTYGWSEVCRPYGSRAAATVLLEANGIRAADWILAGTQDELRADLVVSLLAWGFHFPLSTYKVRGFCIADLRLGHEAPRGTLISGHEKSERRAFTC